MSLQSVKERDANRDLEVHHAPEKIDVEDPKSQEQEAIGVDPVLEKRLIRKLDIYIMPTVMLLYLFSALDRGNLGNLRLLGLIGPRGLPKDPDGSQYSMLVAVFFIGYATLAIPFGAVAKRFDYPYIQVFVAAMIWGTAASVSGAVNTWSAAIGTRFLLSVGEAMYQPVVALMLAKWYSRRELALRFVLFYSTGAISGCLNGLIAYGLNFSKGKVAPWRLLYIIDGTPTIALALWSFFSLPGGIGKSKRLNSLENQTAIARLAARETIESPQLHWKQMISILWSWPIMLPAVANMCAVLVGYVINIFLPVLVHESGYSGAIAQLYTLPAYGSALVTMCTAGYLSDRIGKRAPFVIFAFCLMTIGNAIVAGVPPSASSTSRHARYAGLCLMTNGSLIIIPMKFTWLSENAGNESRRAVAIPLVLALGQAISAASGYLFPENQGPRYLSGTLTCLGISILGLACSVAYVLLCIVVNRRRDKKEGQLPPGHVPDTASFADKALGFRYRW